MLSCLEESGYDLGTASLGLVSRGGLSVGANVGNLGGTCADICAWMPTAFLSSDCSDLPKHSSMTVEVGDQIIAMRKDGHWCQATVQSIGTFDVVTILWEDGMTGDVKKSQGLLRPMGKILGHTCPRGVTYGGVKVPGDLREVPLSREHQKLQELAHLIRGVCEVQHPSRSCRCHHSARVQRRPHTFQKRLGRQRQCVRHHAGGRGFTQLRLIRANILRNSGRRS